MLLSLLLIVAQPVAEADSLNGVLTNCLFATARRAHGEAQSIAQFQVTLDGSCRPEESAARRSIVAILKSRGRTAAVAEREVGETLRQGRAAVIQAYGYGMAPE